MARFCAACAFLGGGARTYSLEGPGLFIDGVHVWAPGNPLKVRLKGPTATGATCHDRSGVRPLVRPHSLQLPDDVGRDIGLCGVEVYVQIEAYPEAMEFSNDTWR